MMLLLSLLALLSVDGAVASPLPQGPNTIAQYNPTLRTFSTNETFMVLPLNSEVVASVVAPRKLVPVDAADSSKYPSGWPAGTHPVLLRGGLEAYIEQLGLEIPNFLMHASLLIPNVDQLGDGKTPFIYDLSDYIGGANGQLLSSAVPALVSTLEGITVRDGTFTPNGGAALQDIGGGQSAFQVDNLLVPNPVSGPAVAPNVFQMIINKVPTSSLLTAKGFHSLISQTFILNDGLLCANQPIYFNETFARPFFCEGTATVFSAPLDVNGVPAALAGTYTNGSCYSATGQTIGYNPQPCDQAAADLDPAALE